MDQLLNRVRKRASNNFNTGRKFFNFCSKCIGGALPKAEITRKYGVELRRKLVGADEG